jgi:uncharacterized protein (DUF1501 family)
VKTTETGAGQRAALYKLWANTRNPYSERLRTEVACLKRSGFDSHSSQAESVDGILTEFSASLVAFVANMKSKNL